MKVIIYIQKTDFTLFFKWVQNLKNGMYLQTPIKFYESKESLKDYVQILLEDSEYALIQSVSEKYKKIQESYGDLSINQYDSKPNYLLAIRDVVTAAEKMDKIEEVIYNALQIATEIPGLTPLEAMAIAERDCLHNIKYL